jgi:acyl-homoserine-lactone acylase
MNANDSYRFTNLGAPEAALERSPLYGDDATRPSPRTLANLALLADGDGAAGDDGRFTLEEAAGAMLSNRSFTAERLRADVLDACRPVKAPRCQALAAWDGRFDATSRGAVLWREIMAELAVDGEVPWKLAFDRQAPTRTPAGVARARPDIALAIDRAAVRLEAAGVAVDAALGELQHAPRNEARLPLPGGDDLDGVANVVAYRAFNGSLLPATPRGPASSTGLSRDGYVVNYGSSFILAAELTAAGPRARALLTYGNSSDPASPAYRDQLERFARGELRPVLFTEADIAADPALVTEEIRSR